MLLLGTRVYFFYNISVYVFFRCASTLLFDTRVFFFDVHVHASVAMPQFCMRMCSPWWVHAHVRELVQVRSTCVWNYLCTFAYQITTDISF